MESAEGVTLRECLLQNYCFAERQGLIIIASLILMLEHMHSKKILHRDLKPENILITEAGIRVVDLGIAKRYTKKENAGERSGTLAYIAPETLFRQNYDYCVDYYSLGIILHEIIFKKVPIYKDNEKDLMQIFTGPQYEITM